MLASETQGNPPGSKVASGLSCSYDLLALSLFALALAAIYLPIALQGLSACSPPLTNDVGFQWIPFKEFQARSLSQNYFPLWTPHTFAGMPYLAFSHAGVLYPLGWILALSDYARAVNWFFPLHLWIAACGLYFLFRRLDISRLSAWLASANVIFTGMFYYNIHFLPSLCTLAWAPWLLLALLELDRQGRFPYLALLVLSLALQILGGDVESAFYGLAFGFLLLLLLRWRQPQFSSLRPFALALGLILSLLLVLAQFLPLWEYSHHFIRAQGITFNYYRPGLVPLGAGAALFWPVTEIPGFAFISGAPTAYLGLIPLLFAPLALLRRAKPTSWPLTLLAFFTLFFLSGKFEPLDRILYRVPLINKFGGPGRTSYLFQIFLGLLAAQGLDLFLAMSSRARRITLILLASLAAGLFGFGYHLAVLSPGIHLVFIGLAGAALLALFSPLRRAQAGLALILLFGFDTYALAYRYCPRHDPEIFEVPQPLRRFARLEKRNPGRYQAITNLYLQDPELLHHFGFRLGLDSLGGYMTLPPLRFAQLLNRIDPHVASFKGGMIDRLSLDGYLRDHKSFNAQSWPLLDLLNLRYILDRQLPLKFASPAFLALVGPERQVETPPGSPPHESEPSRSRNLRMRGPGLVSYRFFIEPEDRLQLQLKAGQALGLVFLNQSGINHLLFARWSDSSQTTMDLTRWASQEANLTFASVNAETHEGVEWDSPAIVNRKRPLQEVTVAGLNEDPDPITIYRNSEALPRAFIAHQVEIIPNDEKLLDRLTAMTRDHLRQTLLFSRPSPGTARLERLAGSAAGLAPEPVDLIGDFPDRQSYHLLALRPGYLFVSDQYLPGWRAWVDGKERPIEQADYCLRAVFLEAAGQHQVTFSYQPKSFHVGLWASLTSLFLLGLAGFYAITVGKRFSKRTT
jgi:hypothetical protein